MLCLFLPTSKIDTDRGSLRCARTISIDFPCPLPSPSSAGSRVACATHFYLKEGRKMTIQLHAQSYDISAAGFYFKSADEYTSKAKALRNDYGDPVEEFEIQFIDGDSIDCDLANAIGLNEANFTRFFEIIDEWEEWQKLLVILAVGECGFSFDENTDPDDFDIDIYEVDSLRELAEQFVDDGLFGEVPEQFQYYIDYDKIARNLACDYSETVINGSHLVYRCG
jgi:hypothetical protein